MNFLDGHLFPENQQPLIITAAPYAPGWLPSDFAPRFDPHPNSIEANQVPSLQQHEALIQDCWLSSLDAHFQLPNYGIEKTSCA